LTVNELEPRVNRCWPRFSRQPAGSLPAKSWNKKNAKRFAAAPQDSPRAVIA
jgi:hypothetical protein